MDNDDLVELFATFGAVKVRRMFGGAGVYADGMMFVLVADGVIYLKAGTGNTPDFDREALEPFAYTTRNGRRGVMSYRRMPERLYDDPEELAQWARAALQAAREGNAAKAMRAKIAKRPAKAVKATKKKRKTKN